MAVKVRPQVRAFPPAGKPDFDLLEGGAVERGETVKLTGKSSYLRVALKLNGQKVERGLRGDQKFAFTATALLAGQSEIQFGDSASTVSSTIQLLFGKLRLALLPGEPHVDVETPEAVAGVKGTYLRILADPVIGTFIAVDEGVVTVQAKAGGAPVEVTAGHGVLVPPGGLPQRPGPLGPGGAWKGFSVEPFMDPPLLDGLDPSTEPPKG
ncbi:MAG TPA: FecR domain-containing protein [Thermoanaerobaculia bacterium]|nr:FecR domain-containing protein [Thermoanaerobaculia bacterium]